MKRTACCMALIIISTASMAQSILPDVPDGVQAISLLGEELRSGEPSERLLDNLAAARVDYESNPDDADNIIWLGRRIAYTGDYRGAIEVFSQGIEKHPEDARMVRRDVYLNR